MSFVEGDTEGVGKKDALALRSYHLTIRMAYTNPCCYLPPPLQKEERLTFKTDCLMHPTLTLPFVRGGNWRSLKASAMRNGGVESNFTSIKTSWETKSISNTVHLPCPLRRGRVGKG